MLQPSRARPAEPEKPYLTYETRLDPADCTNVITVPVANIPLADGGEPAQCDAADWNRLMEGGYSDHLFWHRNGTGAAYLRTTHPATPRRTFIPARFIVGAGWGKHVRYRDKNPRNLGRDNLMFSAGFAKDHENPATVSDEW